MNEQKQNIVLASDHHDGFSDPNYGGSRSIIKGSKIKFTNDFRWLAGANEIDPAREFLVIEILRVEQKWSEQQAVETRILKPDERPNVDELNEAAPRSEWHDYFGKFVGPWQFSYVLYLLEPATMGTFTYPTSTIGGCIAVDNLKDATCRARRVYGENYYPLVTLGTVHMNTAYNGREAPALNVKTFVPIRPAAEGAPTIAGPEAPTIDAKKTDAKRGDSDVEMKVAIP
jgi:hypothetical protein